MIRRRARQSRRVAMPVRFHPHIRLAIAVLFGAATTLYSLVWIAHTRVQRPVRVVLGIEYESDGRSNQLRVTAVQPDSPAAAAGLQPGDVLIAVNGQPLETREPLRDALRNRTPGEGIELLVQRGGIAPPDRVVVILGDRHRPTGELLAAILAEVRAFSVGEQGDDLTLVVAKARP